MSPTSSARASIRTSGRALAAVVLTAVLTVLPGPAAHASYPGGVGRLAFARNTEASGRSEIYSIRPDSSGLTRLTFGEFQFEPAYSPDGSSLAYVSYATGGGFEIFTIHADGSHRRRLTFLGGLALSPDFSPDGRRVAFTARVGSSAFELYVVNTDGSGLRRIGENRWDTYDPKWSPDGRSILFTSDENSLAWQVEVLDLASGHLTQLTHDGRDHSSSTDWSPDGRKIAYTTRSGRDHRIWVMDANGSRPHQVSSAVGMDDRQPAWAPDGSAIAFVRVTSPARAQLWVMRPDGSGARLVLGGGEMDAPTWQPLPG